MNTHKLIISSLLGAIIALSSFVSAHATTTDSIPVTIHTSGYQTDPADNTKVYTQNHTISLTGSAGIQTIVTGNAVESADLSHLDWTGSTDISINLKQAATKATVISCRDYIDRDDITFTDGGSININGIEINYLAFDTVGHLIDKINAASAQTGVTADLDISGYIHLNSVTYGSSARIDITNGLETLGFCYQIAGTDTAASITTDTGMNISDANWTKGQG